MKKKMIIVVIVVFVIGTFIVMSVIKEKDSALEIDHKCRVLSLKDIGEVRSNSITVDGATISTFCTFKDQKEALKNIKVESSELLSKIMLRYGLNDLSDSNWKEYYDVLESYIGTLEGDEYTDMIREQHIQLRAFFDIYGDVERNEEIEKYVKQSKTSVIDDCEFIDLLPYHAEITKDNSTKVLSKCNRS